MLRIAFIAILLVHLNVSHSNASMGRLLSTNAQKIEGHPFDSGNQLECNYKLTGLFLLGDLKSPQDISSMCPKVNNSCCSMTHMHYFKSDFKAEKKYINGLIQTIRNMLNEITEIPEDRINAKIKLLYDPNTGVKKLEDELVLSYDVFKTVFARKHKIVKTLNEYFERKMTFLSGFACSLCDLPNQQNFILKSEGTEVERVVLKNDFCVDTFADNLVLISVLKNLQNIFMISNEIARIDSTFKKIDIDLFTKETVEFVKTNFECHYQFKNMGLVKDLPLHCKVLCHDHLRLNKFEVPLNIMANLETALWILKREFKLKSSLLVNKEMAQFKKTFRAFKIRNLGLKRQQNLSISFDKNGLDFTYMIGVGICHVSRMVSGLFSLIAMAFIAL